MDDEWYYQRNGEQTGPVTAATLLQLHREGAVTDRTIVVRAGDDTGGPFAESGLANSIGTNPSERSSSDRHETNHPVPPPLPRRGPKPPPPPPSALPRLIHLPREARLRRDSAVRIGACLDRAWHRMLANFWPFVGMAALASILLGLAGQLLLPLFFLSFPILAGCYFYYLKSGRQRQTSIDDAFEGFRRRFGDLTVLNLAFTLPFLLIVVASVAITVVAVIWAVEQGGGALTIGMITGFSILCLLSLALATSLLGALGGLVSLLCLDCEISAGEALRLSLRALRRHPFGILAFGVVATVLAYAGLLLLYVGAFVTTPWTMAATACLYEDLFGEEEPPSSPLSTGSGSAIRGRE